MTTPTLTLHHPGGTILLGAGERLTFGRVADMDGPPDRAPHLGLSDSARLHQHAGAVTVDEAGWVLANTGRWLHLVVTRSDGGDRNDLAPGRVLRVPYRRCRVEVSTGDESVGFDAECSRIEEGDGPVATVAGDTVQGLGLDRSTGYFRALVALCEPRLRDPATDDVASVNQIVRTLNLSATEPERVSVKAVERRLAHVRRKLGLGGDPAGISAAGLEQRNAGHQLADLMLRTGTVTAPDLTLIVPAGTTADEPSG